MTQPTTEEEPRAKILPPLANGDRLDQPTFHERYEAMPPGTHAELIGGEVHMPSPVSWDHGSKQDDTGYWLTTYRRAAPGMLSASTPTCVMGVTFEPQPDHTLFLREDCGGQVRRRGKYIGGAPELVAEIAMTSESIDLHRKRDEYERHGVQEYIVVGLHQDRVIWFTRQHDAFVEIVAGKDGLLRSSIFPGLWLDPLALLAEDIERVLAVLALGLASPEHAAFVAELERRRAERGQP